MPKDIHEYSCLLISPSDVKRERDALTDLVTNWNAQIGKALGARIDLVRWESHATPDLSTKPQEAINAQLVEDCDFGIAVFWSRIGTPTKKHPSGSIEEIDRLIRRGARVLVYFNSSAIPQEVLNDDQFKRLQKIKKRFQKNGLVATYSDVSELREKVQLHLTHIVTELLSREFGQTAQLPQAHVLTAPTPDIRVKVQPAVTTDAWDRNIDLLVVSVQNHSPVPVFIGNVYFPTREETSLLLLADSITRERQTRRRLEPGESFDFHVIRDQLAEGGSAHDLMCAAVKDAIGHGSSRSSCLFKVL